jgi:hypothetical protein
VKAIIMQANRESLPTGDLERDLINDPEINRLSGRGDIRLVVPLPIHETISG